MELDVHGIKISRNICTIDKSIIHSVLTTTVITKAHFEIFFWIGGKREVRNSSMCRTQCTPCILTSEETALFQYTGIQPTCMCTSCTEYLFLVLDQFTFDHPKFVLCPGILNPLTPESTQESISPFNNSRISSSHVTRIKKILLKGLSGVLVSNSPN